MELSFQSIQQMCNVCEVTGCWHWKGGTASGMVPQMREGLGRAPIRPVRALVLEMLDKRRPARNPIATNTCMNRDCVAPEHACWLSRQELQQRTAEVTNYGARPERRLNISKAMRARSPRTIEDVREMRASGLTLKELSEEYGVAKSTAGMILRGEMWRDHTSPFAGLGAR